jgi:hypothetical protein
MKDSLLDLSKCKGGARLAEWMVVVGVIMGTGGFVLFRVLVPQLDSVASMVGMEIVAIAGN